jgi:VIT1/CCC1 family predicted Fe2+/Mn2+ transporter
MVIKSKKVEKGRIVKDKIKKEFHTKRYRLGHGSRLNWIRAGVLGANDGIVSTAGLVVGVASATNSQIIIFTAGLAGVIAGAISMAAGEYMSVSSQRDSERELLEKERKKLRINPKHEFEELISIFEEKGLKKTTAMIVAKELTSHAVFDAHVQEELGIDPHNLANPWHAALSSAVSFVVGAVIPLVAILIPPENVRVGIAFVSVVIALAFTGIASAKIGGASVIRATVRVVAGGVFAMIVTYSIGRIFHVSV